MKESFNWGILGPGKIAHSWTEGLKLLPDAQLHAVGSRDMGRASEFAAQHGFRNAYGSYKDLVADGELDIVYVASPHSHHMEHTLLCLENGIAVVCEKAFALNSREVRLMVNTARSKGIFLMEALWPPFQPSYRKAGELLKEEDIGDIVSLRSFFVFKPPYEPDKRLYKLELGGGALLDIGIYPVIDALTFLGVPTDMDAQALFDKTGADSQIEITFSYESGKSAFLYASFDEEKEVGTDIICESGVVSLRRLNNGSQMASITRPGTDPEEYIYTPPARGYHFEADEVMKQIRKGERESEIVPLSFSIDLMKTLDRIRKKAGIIYPGRD